MRTRGIFPIDVACALLDMCEASGIRIRTLLLDREFYQTGVMNLPYTRGIIWRMPADKTDAIKRTISEFERNERDSVSGHQGRTDKIRADCTRIIRSAKDKDDARGL